MRFYTSSGKLKILYKCEFHNQEINVTELVDELCKYGLYDCPVELYQAWKILRLGTNEYHQGDSEHRILVAAMEKLKIEILNI